MTPEIIVATWNLQGRDPERVELVDAMTAWRPDIVLLQEADGGRIRGLLRDAYPTCLSWPDAGERPGLAIVSSFEARAFGVAPAGVRAPARPRLAWARFEVGDGSMTVASIHLQAPPWPGTPRRRRAQRTAVAAWAAEQVRAGDHVVVGGDCNTTHPSLDALEDVSALSPARTWRPLAGAWMPGLFRIDAIFIGPTMRVLSSSVDGRWRRSDHLPVVTRLRC